MRRVMVVAGGPLLGDLGTHFPTLNDRAVVTPDFLESALVNLVFIRNSFRELAQRQQEFTERLSERRAGATAERGISNSILLAYEPWRRTKPIR